MNPQAALLPQIFSDTKLLSPLQSENNTINDQLELPIAYDNNSVLESFNGIESDAMNGFKDKDAYIFDNTCKNGIQDKIDPTFNSATQYFAHIYNVFNNIELFADNSSDMLSSTVSCTSTPPNQYVYPKNLSDDNSFDNLLNDFSSSHDNFRESTFEDSLQFSDNDNTISNTMSCTSPTSESTCTENYVYSHSKTSSKNLRRMSHPVTPSYIGTKKNKYGCKYCGKHFSRPSSLSTHLNIHTGDKPFICPYKDCSKRFNARSNMTRHHKTHFKTPTSENLLS
ncbi:hypothetical protein MOSE0_H02322 [Monosporozyma servazzii]